MLQLFILNVFQFRIFVKLNIIQHIGPSVLNVMFQHALSSLLRRLHNLCLKSLVTRILCEVAISYDFLTSFLTSTDDELQVQSNSSVCHSQLFLFSLEVTSRYTHLDNYGQPHLQCSLFERKPK